MKKHPVLSLKLKSQYPGSVVPLAMFYCDVQRTDRGARITHSCSFEHFKILFLKPKLLVCKFDESLMMMILVWKLKNTGQLFTHTHTNIFTREHKEVNTGTDTNTSEEKR